VQESTPPVEAASRPTIPAPIGQANAEAGDAQAARGHLTGAARETKTDPVVFGFAELGLSEPILRAVHEIGYLTPTPIQQQAIPSILMGRDVLGCAQTGTGKTAGFTLPMLDILSGSRARARMPRSLILEPTRELALQVAESFVKYGKHMKLTHALIIGGESMSDQKDLLMRGVDVLIATPGRLIDMFERGGMLLTQTSVLVIDEADRMLDMGFIPDVERIVAMLPANRQTLFFSATMAPEIRRLADAFLNNPKEIIVSKPATVATTITAGLVLVTEQDKRESLRRLIRSEDVQNALIFCNRKRDVDILFKSLTRHGFSVGALHGDMPQPVRFATLEKFKANETRLLCCSDVAARGLDIGGLSHVFNFDVPVHAEDYVHRIGRTGRAGRAGRALTIATPDERQAVMAIEKLTGAPIPRITIDGLDLVDWSDDEGRGRRRGRRKPGARTLDSKKPQDRKKETKKAEPRKGESRRERSRSLSAGEKPEPSVEPPASRQDRVSHADRFQRRDRDTRRRDDDLGPSIVGFGDDIPAFMLVAARPRRHAAHASTSASVPPKDAE
jgi:superfamily II DNA/RNA helicase